MNQQHLELCGSDEWAEAVERYIIPWALKGVDLGEHVMEVGPGPGRTTDLFRNMVPRLTAVEIDPALAAALHDRMAGSNVAIVHADGTALPFPDDTFSGAVSFTMLHHVPTPALQDRMLGEVARVLRPGGVFAGVDSLDSEDFRALHVDDICVPVVPDEFAGRLERAGFTDVGVDTNEYAVRFQARHP